MQNLFLLQTALTKKYNFIFLGELFSKKFSFQIQFLLSKTDILSLINIYLRSSSIGEYLFKVDALGTLFRNDILTLGVDIFLESMLVDNCRVEMLISPLDSLIAFYNCLILAFCLYFSQEIQTRTSLNSKICAYFSDLYLEIEDLSLLYDLPYHWLFRMI